MAASPDQHTIYDWLGLVIARLGKWEKLGEIGYLLIGDISRPIYIGYYTGSCLVVQLYSQLLPYNIAIFALQKAIFSLNISCVVQ